MSDAVLADPQGQRQLPFDSVRLNDYALDVDAASVWPDPRWPEGIEIGVARQEFRRQGVQPMSMDHGLKLVDAWVAERQAWPSNDALGISSEPERKKRRFEVECDVAPRQVKFQRHEQRNEDLESDNAFLAGWQGHSPSTTGIWDGGAHDIAPYHETTPAQEQQLECRAAVVEPGSQAPGVAVNGVALRLPHIKLPSDAQDATASGSPLQKILNEVSAGANLMAAR
jgi:hypothetical protein